MKDDMYSAPPNAPGGSPADVAPATEELADGELSADELEHVVGGLARAWFEGLPGVATLRDYQRGVPSAYGL